MKQLKNKISIEIKKAVENSEFWITRKALARMAGVSETTLYKGLNGEGSLDNLMKVAKVLNIEIDIK
jgi:DNA-binding phage protein